MAAAGRGGPSRAQRGRRCPWGGQMGLEEGDGCNPPPPAPYCRQTHNIYIPPPSPRRCQQHLPESSREQRQQSRAAGPGCIFSGEAIARWGVSQKAGGPGGPRATPVAEKKKKKGIQTKHQKTCRNPLNPTTCETGAAANDGIWGGGGPGSG